MGHDSPTQLGLSSRSLAGPTFFSRRVSEKSENKKKNERGAWVDIRLSPSLIYFLYIFTPADLLMNNDADRSIEWEPK